MSPLRYSWKGIADHYRRTAARFVFRRPLRIRTRGPYISFTFDDFPRSALFAGGAILNRYELTGTYYVSLGILGEDSPSGKLCVSDDLSKALELGHELGCHTYSHCDSWDTKATAFRDAVRRNREELGRLVPGLEFKSFSYPKSEPHPLAKLEASKHFLCCRSGGQRIN